MLNQKSPHSANGKHPQQLESAKKQKKCTEEQPLYIKLQEERKQLPIFSARKKLLVQLQSLSSAIVIGETASGKTTQIPQYLYEAHIHRNKTIACTQPRRVAAITVAQRVASEKGVELGDVVGYCVRFDDMTNENTKIKYMTDGMLLREAILDPLLTKYSVVILDEAHERTIHTDVLFGVVKKAQRQRNLQSLPSLKLIVMSATMDVDHFQKYFNNAPVLYIEGRQFPVQLMYACEEQSDYLFSALVTVFQIHQTAPANEDILVFLTGQEEIESMVKSIKDIALDLPQDCPAVTVCPMYAALAPHQQLKAFQPAPKGHRKVIVCTNIAETSVTINGIKHVIDPGMVKAKSYNPNSGLDLLKVQHISQAQAWQRTGRAGRQSAGHCYRLYTEPYFQKMLPNTIPEIQRCNLSSVVLQLLALGIKKVVQFDFMDRPSEESLQNAVQQLRHLGAIVAQENKDSSEKLQLSAVGKKMAAFPLDPRFARSLLAASENKCLEEVLSIVSILSVESVLLTPQNKREEAIAARRKFISPDGDHLTLLNIYKAFRNFNGNKHWCFENFVNSRNLRMAQEVRKQLRQICERLDLVISSAGRDTAPIGKSFASGFFMNSAELLKEGEFVTLNGRKSVAIHPSSALFMCNPSCVLYTELVQTTKSYMRNICAVDMQWLYEVAPNYFRTKSQPVPKSDTS